MESTTKAKFLPSTSVSKLLPNKSLEKRISDGLKMTLNPQNLKISEMLGSSTMLSK